MAKKRKYRRRNRASGATAFVVKVGGLCCVLLVLNAALCQMLCVLLQSALPRAFEDLRTVQAIMYFGPILMICIEFWIYDRRVDALSKSSTEPDPELVGVSGQESQKTDPAQ